MKKVKKNSFIQCKNTCNTVMYKFQCPNFTCYSYINIKNQIPSTMHTIFDYASKQFKILFNNWAIIFKNFKT